MILACPRRPELHPRRLFLFLRPLFVLLALGLSLPAGPPAAAETASPPAERVLVTDVIDGDTVKVVRGRRQETVRLIGVDTPETGRPDTPVQFHGPEAALFTRRSLIGKRVRLEFEPPDRLGGSADKYHRTLAYIFTDEGMNFNLELVRLGHGRTYTKYPFRYQREFSKAEQDAREAGLGLWNKSKRTEWSDAVHRGKIIGNVRTDIYHLPGQRYYHAIGEKNRIYFQTEEEAREAGFRRAKN